ncbi:hypothetical protein [Streptomyces sp. NPDC016845]|uniref:hypothetical protein n=1 Tax=Streptomyces sp. NPDC016845 TaxID=3364972 RepID=UPI0037AEDF1C
MPRRPRVLYVTDLAYQARGRRYCDEDIFLTSRLRSAFDLALCHPLDATALMDGFDVVVVRNSGPVLGYQEAYAAFRAEALARGTTVYNPLTGRADMAGKQYLPDLTRAGHPVIPTVESAADLDRLPEAGAYVVKPKLGADSMGLRVVSPAELHDLPPNHALLIQPHIDFTYEVSFYFVDRTLQYSLYAPDPERRWDLRPYEPTTADRAFARHFIDWNALPYGIQRVDACRTREGALLLVELEDLNPYLSLGLLDEATRDAFVTAMTESVREAVTPLP